MERSVIRDSGYDIPPDFASLHPGYRAPTRHALFKHPHKKENARGERAFSVVNLGVVGVV